MAGSHRGTLPAKSLPPTTELSKVTPSIILVELGRKLLAEFPDSLSDYARHSLETLGVEIRTGTEVTAIEDGVVHTGSGRIDTATIVWTAGTAATPVAKWLGVEPGKGGRVAVDATLRVPRPARRVRHRRRLPGHGRRRQARLPGLAPVAKQQGEYVGRAVLDLLAGREPAPFAYKDYGTLATIGRGRAVAELGPVKVKGATAWALLGRGAHLLPDRLPQPHPGQRPMGLRLRHRPRRPGRLISWNPKAR